MEFKQMSKEEVSRRSPVYQQLQELGAVTSSVREWEAPLYYEQNTDRSDEYDLPAHIDESPAVGVEHQAVREGVGLINMVSQAPIEIAGPNASSFVQRAFTNDMAMDVNHSKYAPMLNHDGGILGDLVVSRLDDDRYFAFTVGGELGMEHTAWLKDAAPSDVSVTNLDDMYTSLCVWGEDALEVVQPLTDYDLSRDAFPFFGCHQFEIEGIPVWATRLSYVGEFGWELWTPLGYESQLWDKLWESGQEHDIIPFGIMALLSMSVEKDYRLPGADMGPNRNPFEARLDHTVDLNTEFIGKEALEHARESGIDEQITCITMDEDDVLPDVGAAIFAGEEDVGEVARAEYGYYVGENIVNAYLPVEKTDPGTPLEIGIDGTRHSATVRDPPLFDPNDERLR